MEEEEEEVSRRHPEPVYLDEIRVQEIALEREVAWCLSGRVRLGDRVVWRVSRRGIDEREEGAEKESRWIYEEKDLFDRSWHER